MFLFAPFGLWNWPLVLILIKFLDFLQQMYLFPDYSIPYRNALYHTVPYRILREKETMSHPTTLIMQVDMVMSSSLFFSTFVPFIVFSNFFTLSVYFCLSVFFINLSFYCYFLFISPSPFTSHNFFLSLYLSFGSTDCFSF